VTNKTKFEVRVAAPTTIPRILRRSSSSFSHHSVRCVVEEEGPLIASSGAPVIAEGELSKAVKEEIGGMDEVILSLEEMIVLPFARPEVFKYYKLDPPKGKERSRCSRMTCT
jgi:ATP-dependent 26S proteasome regulatory subunit